MEKRFTTCGDFLPHFYLSCRPKDEPYQYGLLLPWGIIHLLSYARMLISPCVRKQLSSKSSPAFRNWLREHIGLLVALILFDIAWGVGLPSMHPLDLGSTRKVLQVAFIIASFFLGLAVFVAFCLLSHEVRRSWIRMFSFLIPGRRGSYPPANGTIATDHMEMPAMEMAEAGLGGAENTRENIYEVDDKTGGDLAFFNEGASLKEERDEKEEGVSTSL